MKDFQLSPDDPRLTAYALGELDGDERAAVEAALRRDPALRTVVDDIRTTAARLEEALAAEAIAEVLSGTGVSPVDGAQRRETWAGRPCHSESTGNMPVPPPSLAHAGRNGTGPHPYRIPRGKLLGVPQLYFVVSGLAAAAFALFVALRPTPSGVPAVRSKQYTVVSAPAPTAPLAEVAGEPVTVSLPVAPPAREAVADTTTPVVESVVTTVTPPPEESATMLEAAATPAAIAAVEEVRGANAAPLREFSYTVPPIGSLMLSDHPPLGAGAGARPTAELQIGAGVERVRDFAVPQSQTAARPKQGQRVAMPKTAANEAQRRVASAEKQAGQPSTTTVPAAASSAPVATTALQTAQAPAATGSAAARDAFSVNAERAGAARSSATAPLTSFRSTAFGFDAIRPGTIAEEPGASMPARTTGYTESYAYRRDSDFLAAKDNPLSTFSVDTDTASYTNIRRFLQSRRVPPADAVRIEELLNYFPYRYTAPAIDEAVPFAASMEVAEAPWAPAHRLVRIGLKGRVVTSDARPAANLVFLLDVSGSMNQPNKLSLVKQSMRLLLGKLRPDDRVAIVTYAGNSGLALESTPVASIRKIEEAIESLVAAGSTNGAKGIQLAYEIARANFTPTGINRVILCTDGDFNVGVTSEGELVRLVEEKAGSGVFLTVLGFGMGNLKDSMLEALADKGNGHYGYIDTPREAEKLLVDQVNSTLVTIAKDVKVQVEFNPAKVARYRLIGYENRALKSEDFNNDKVDAGEIGAGHTVTALYEIVLAGAEEQSPASAPAPVDDLKYQTKPVSATLPPAMVDDLLTVKVRYKEPAGEASKRLEFPLVDSAARFAAASADFKFAAAVAGFGMLLRDSPHKGATTIGDVIAWAAAGAANANDDPGGYRREFLDLARTAQTLLRGE